MITVGDFDKTLSITDCPFRQNKTNKQNTSKNALELNQPGIKRRSWNVLLNSHRINILFNSPWWFCKINRNLEYKACLSECKY